MGCAYPSRISSHFRLNTTDIQNNDPNHFQDALLMMGAQGASCNEACHSMGAICNNKITTRDTTEPFTRLGECQ